LQHQNGLFLSAFFLDGRRFVTAQGDGLVRVWAVPKGHPNDHELPIGGSPTSAGMAATGRYVIPTGDYGLGGRDSLRTARVFEIATGKPGGPELSLGGVLVNAAVAPLGTQALTLCSLAPTREDRYAVLVEPLGKAGRVQFWNWQTGAAQFEPTPMPSEPRAVNYSLDGSLAAVICTGGQVFLFDAATGRVIRQFVHGSWGSKTSCPGVRFTPDGKGLIAWGSNHVVRVWDVQDGRERFDPLILGNLCYEAACSSDGRYLTTGAWDHTARVWDLATGKQLANLKHPEWVFGIAFDAKADAVVTACRDGMARVWDWRRQTLADPPCRHADAVFSAALAGREQYLVTACRDGNARIWHRSTARLVAPPFLLREGRWNWAAPDANDRSCSCWDARVTPDGAHAVVSGQASSLHSLHLGDLGDMSGGDDLPMDEPLLLSELISGFRLVDDHQVEGLTTDEWLTRWRTFRRRHPEFGNSREWNSSK
jgi:WD40 repeat protein